MNETDLTASQGLSVASNRRWLLNATSLGHLAWLLAMRAVSVFGCHIRLTKLHTSGVLTRKTREEDVG